MTLGIKEVLLTVVTAALTVSGAIAASHYGWLFKDRELDIRMVEISLSILSGENAGATSFPARKFALRSLEKFSRVDIPEDELSKWASDGTINFGKLPFKADNAKPITSIQDVFTNMAREKSLSFKEPDTFEVLENWNKVKRRLTNQKKVEEIDALIDELLESEK